MQVLMNTNQDGYMLFKNNIRNTYYIIWRNDNGNEKYVENIKDFIAKDGKQNQFDFMNNYKLFEIQFKKGDFAMRLVNDNRNTNRIYKRHNINIIQCKNCGEIFDKNDKENYNEFDGKFYCSECFNDKFMECENCNDIIPINDGLEADNYIYCQDCFSEKWTYCENCNQVVNRDESYIGTDDNNYCSNCYNDRFTTCEACGDTICIDDSFYDEDEGSSFCSECYDEGLLHQCSYKPSPVFQKETYENTLYLGFELEVETENGKKELAENVLEYLQNLKLDNRFYFKRDGSVPDGFEIVSHPTTMKCYHKRHQLYNIIKYLKTKSISYNSKNCGLHFHVNKDFFDKNDVHKLLLFFNNAENAITIFSQRTQRQIDSYCKFEDFGISDYKYFTKEFPKKWYYPDENDRYMAINIIPDTTVEFRIFRGTLDYKRFLASMQFVDAVCNFVKVNSFTSLTWKNFKNYLRYANRYNHLEKYLKEKNL